MTLDVPRQASLTALLNATLDAVAVMRADGIVIGWNEPACRAFGWTKDEAVGRRLSDLIVPPDYRARHEAGVRRFLTTGEMRVLGKRIEVPAAHKDGHDLTIELSIMVSVHFGEQLFIGFMRDLSERKEAEAKIATLQAEVVHLARNAAMGNMAAVIAHELNQPLTAASNYLVGAYRLLGKEGAEARDQAREAVHKAQQQAIRAGDIIRRIRELIARREMKRERVSVRRAVDDAVALLHISRLVGEVPIDVDIRKGAEWVLGDRIQIEQIFLNLIRNAIEALADTKDPRITVIAQVAGNQIELCVRDNGPGLPPHLAADPFASFSGGVRGGLGLGLSISRTIVEAHGGRMWATAQKPSGTAFCFTFPAEPPPA